MKISVVQIQFLEKIKLAITVKCGCVTAILLQKIAIYFFPSTNGIFPLLKRFVNFSIPLSFNYLPQEQLDLPLS